MNQEWRVDKYSGEHLDTPLTLQAWTALTQPQPYRIGDQEGHVLYPDQDLSGFVIDPTGDRTARHFVQRGGIDIGVSAERILGLLPQEASGDPAALGSTGKYIVTLYYEDETRQFQSPSALDQQTAGKLISRADHVRRLFEKELYLIANSQGEGRSVAADVWAAQTRILFGDANDTSINAALLLLGLLRKNRHLDSAEMTAIDEVAEILYKPMGWEKFAALDIFDGSSARDIALIQRMFPLFADDGQHLPVLLEQILRSRGIALRRVEDAITSDSAFAQAVLPDELYRRLNSREEIKSDHELNMIIEAGRMLKQAVRERITSGEIPDPYDLPGVEIAIVDTLQPGASIITYKTGHKRSMEETIPDWNAFSPEFRAKIEAGFDIK